MALHLHLLAATLLAGGVAPRTGRVGRTCARLVRADVVVRAGVYEDDHFKLEIDLGDGAGIVRQALSPLFSSSELITVRMPLPFELDAEPALGVIRVQKSGYGLCAGDVLRACSTFRLRLQTDPWLGLLPVTASPTKCLFVADGMPPAEVVRALRENTPERTSEVLLIFERPKRDSHNGPWI